jgi:hypothetical protein
VSSVQATNVGRGLAPRSSHEASVHAENGPQGPDLHSVAASARDRGDPTITDVLLWDPTVPMADETRVLAARDLARWSHRALLPWARAFGLALVWCIRVLKAVMPLQFSWHGAIDVLCVWFMRRFVSADAAELLIRHFIVETNLLAFIARHTGVTEPTLRPCTLEGLGDKAVIQHDLAVYNLVIDVGQSRAPLAPPASLDFTALKVPAIDAARDKKRWIELDIETALYLMNIPFCLFTTQHEYERAVNSFQLDESVCAMLAQLTGDATFRTWTPVKFPAWISVRRDVARDLFWHAAVCEYAHTTLEGMRDGRRS